jgi:hypothetical protein
MVHSVSRQGDGEVTITNVAYAGGNQYFYFKIIQSHDDDEGTDRVWTAPVWFEPNVVTPPVPSGPSTLRLSVDRVKGGSHNHEHRRPGRNVDRLEIEKRPGKPVKPAIETAFGGAVV